MRFVAPALLLFLTACASNTAPMPPPVKLDFAPQGVFGLNVAQINVVSDSVTTSQQPPYIGHTLQPTMEQAVQNWVNDRLRAKGNKGYATVLIKTAEVKNEKLPVKQGLDSAFTRQQAARWNAELEVTINVEIPDTGYSGFASAKVSRSKTLPEDATAAERAATWNQILTWLMNDLNRELQINIQQHLNGALTGPDLGMIPARR
jgi:hypothetical protein